MATSGFTKVNLRGLDDMAPRFGLSPSVEARFARRALRSEIGGLGLLRLAPNARAPFGHRHAQQEELYVVVAGSGRARLDDEIVDVGPWDVLRVAPETMRAFEAGPDGLEYLAFGAPVAPEPDSELVPGWWD
ncbi:MAG: cupin domain-containing protein [Thermoleophilia bacterium]|nr:cupin domain-containing protein [Thermoleophilia bacterium]